MESLGELTSNQSCYIGKNLGRETFARYTRIPDLGEWLTRKSDAKYSN